MEYFCHRCRKQIMDGESGYHHAKYRKPDGYHADGKGYWILRDGVELARVTMYHKRCLPPVLFHRVAGSLPASQALTEFVPQQ